MTDDISIDLFVYGTLLKGQSNHHWLQDAPYLGPDALANGCLFDMGEYPMLLPGADLIAGEVYCINTNILANLDQLEEHPRVYHRQSVVLQSGRVAQVYWGKPIWIKEQPMISGGSWRQYVQSH